MLVSGRVYDFLASIFLRHTSIPYSIYSRILIYIYIIYTHIFYIIHITWTHKLNTYGTCTFTIYNNLNFNLTIIFQFSSHPHSFRGVSGGFFEVAQRENESLISPPKTAWKREEIQISWISTVAGLALPSLDEFMKKKKVIHGYPYWMNYVNEKNKHTHTHQK